MGRGDDLTSPELQEHVVRGYCERRGYEPLLWLCDVDMTGRSWSRRSVEQAVKMIEAGEADLIVVPRWSRFTRNLRDYVIQLARIEGAGGRVESALEETDPATSAGLLQRDLFAILAQWESRKIGEQWKETHARRRRAGLPHCGRSRLGYQIVDGHFFPHPVEGPLVTSLYRKYLAGAGMVTLSKWLASKGVLSPATGRRWTPFGVRQMMMSGFAAGLLRVGDGYVPGEHTPLISRATWERYRSTQLVRSHDYYPNRLIRPAMALDNLVRCAGCGRLLRLKDESAVKRRGSGYMYQCQTRHCDNAVWVTRHQLEQHVRTWFDQHAAKSQDTTEPQQEPAGSVDSLNARLAGVAAGLVRNRTEYAMGEYGSAMRDLVDASLRQRQTKLAEQIGQLSSASTATLSQTTALEVSANWEQWPTHELNRQLRRHIDRITVRHMQGYRQRVVVIEPHVHIVQDEAITLS
jgi:site-specific DNA recombinase